MTVSRPVRFSPTIILILFWTWLCVQCHKHKTGKGFSQKVNANANPYLEVCSLVKSWCLLWCPMCVICYVCLFLLHAGLLLSHSTHVGPVWVYLSNCSHLLSLSLSFSPSAAATVHRCTTCLVWFNHVALFVWLCSTPFNTCIHTLSTLVLFTLPILLLSHSS